MTIDAAYNILHDYIVDKENSTSDDVLLEALAALYEPAVVASNDYPDDFEFI